MSMMDTGQGSGEELGNGEGTETEVPEYSPSDYADGFLKDVPEEHRSLLEPYIKKWDAGVTRRFQDLNSKVKPYQDAGIDPEALPQVAELWTMLNDNPKDLYDILAEVLQDEISGAGAGNNGQLPVGNQGEAQNLSGNEGSFQVPPELQQQLSQHNEVLNTLAQYILGQEESKKISAEDVEFDNYLGLLKEEFGDFNEEYVVMKIANGMDGGEAVKEWQSVIQEQINASGAGRTHLPPLLSGAGGVPVEQQSVRNLSRADTKKLVAETLARAAQAQQ